MNKIDPIGSGGEPTTPRVMRTAQRSSWDHNVPLSSWGQHSVCESPPKMQQGGMFASGMVFPEYSSQVLESGKTWSQWLTMSFANPEHEREYKKWSWEKNRRRWILMSMALMGWTMLLYVQYIVIGLVSQSRGCNSFTTAYCPDETDIPSMRYIWKWDVGFLFVGGILPFAIILMAYIRMSRETMSYWAGPLFTFFVGGAVNLNVLVRTRVVDPDGDFWNFGLLNLVAIIIIPILANLPSFLTMLFVMSNLIIMIALNTGRFNTRKSLAGPAVLTYVCLSAVTTIIATRLLEVIERDQFAVTYGMNRINRGLRDRLQGLQRQLSSQAADFDSPLEKSIATVKSIMANPVTDRNTFEHLEKVLGWLSNSDKLFTPALENQLHAGVAGVDEEQELWLLNLLAGPNRGVHRNLLEKIRATRSRSSSGRESHASGAAGKGFFERPDQPESEMDMLFRPKKPVGLRLDIETGGLPSLTGPGSPSSPRTAAARRFRKRHEELHRVSSDSIQSGYGHSPHAKKKDGRVLPMLSEDLTRIRPLLDGLDNWTWSIFDLEAVLGGRTLSTMALHLLSSSGLTDRLRIPQGKLTGFLRKVEGLYNAEVPYHNATHAADVLQAIQCFVKASRLPLTDLEMFAVYIAAAIHDLDHPGLNNKFLVETHDPKAILYNDRSVLENHHLATAFTVMMRDDTNILENMDHDDSHRFRELVIGMVMATDISEHFTTLSLFKNKTSGTSPFDPTNNAGDRFALFQMFIKCADVSNLSREWNVYATWLERLQREFMAQGDEEKRRDIPVSPFMDRENVNIAASQLGFIDFICQPMIEVLVKVVTLPPMLEILSQNKDVLLLERDKDAKKKLHKSRASLGGTAGWGSSTSQDDR